jgi:hypothetical protein
MASINDMTPLFLVPIDGVTLFDAMTEGGDSDTYVTADRPGERATLLDGELPVLEVVEDHAGWCLVAVCPVLEDIHALRAMVDGRDGPAIVAELEIASGHVGDFIERMGALAAYRSKGRWRPIDEDARPLWSSHLVDCNTQKLRAQAMAANDDAMTSAKAA